MVDGLDAYGLDGLVQLHQLGDGARQEVEEALDGGQTHVPAGSAIAPVGLEMVEEVQDGLPGDHVHTQRFGLNCGLCADVAAQQAHAVAVGGDGVGGQAALGGEI